MALSSVELIRFKQQYEDSNITMNDLVRIWGHPSGTLYRWGFELGLKRPKTVKQSNIALEQVRQFCEALSTELPAYTLRPSSPNHLKDTGQGRIMEPVLLVSDWHPGRLTKSFDSTVFELRVGALVDRVIEYLKLLRHGYDIRNLRIFALGDLVTGERVGKNILIEELEVVLLKQVYDLCIPQLCALTYRLSGHVEHIYVSTVRGNHGITNRPAVSNVTNWDNVVYLGWQSRMGALQSSVEFDVEVDRWYKYVDVLGKMYLLVHGDQVKGGSPYNGIANKIGAWQSSLPYSFDYCTMGHFHHFNMIRNAWVNATLLTDDDWSREVLGRDGDCGQWLLGCTEQGIECAIPITLKGVR